MDVTPLQKKMLGAALLVAITVAAYWGVGNYGFVFDDFEYIRDNPTLRSLQGLWRIWTDREALPHGQYYPVVLTNFWLEFQVWQVRPQGYHTVNLILQVMVSLLAWRLMAQLELPGAWWIAAAFAIHPVHVETVAWITEQKNLLSAVFTLASASCYLRFALAPPDSIAARRWMWRYAASLFWFGLAILSKTVACTLPAGLFLVVWWKGSGNWRRHLLLLSPYLASGLGLGLLAAMSEAGLAGAVGEQWSESWLERILIAGRAIWFYAGKLAWPEPLIFIYPRWSIDPTSLVQWLYPLCALAAGGTLWFARHRLGRGPLAAIAIYVAILSPTLGFIPFFFMRYSYVADHFQYLASLALLPLLISPLAALAERGSGGRRRALGVVAALVLIAMAAQTSRALHKYESAETLWRDTVQQNPTAWMARLNLGSVLSAQGDYEDALFEYHAALRQLSGHPAAKAKGLIGSTLLAQGKSAESVHYFEEMLEVKPNHLDARYNLATALASMGNIEGAILQYRRVLRIDPKHVPSHNNLGVLMARSDRNAEAIEYFRRVLELEPERAAILMNLGIALGELGKLDEGIRQLRAARKLSPENLDIQRHLMRLRRKHGQ